MADPYPRRLFTRRDSPAAPRRPAIPTVGEQLDAWARRAAAADDLEHGLPDPVRALIAVAMVGGVALGALATLMPL